MNGRELARVIGDAMPTWAASKDELGALDRAIGDGDLGLTVSAGAQAVSDAVAQLEGEPTPAAVLIAVARSFSAANPSTLSALAATGLLSAARELREMTDVGRDQAVVALRAAGRAIAQRGGAEPGDKTVLDALLPSIEALEGAPPDGQEALSEMATAAQAGVEGTTDKVSRRGRAGWVGERTAGHPDGGATAYWRLLEATRDRWPSSAAQMTAGER